MPVTDAVYEGDQMDHESRGERQDHPSVANDKHWRLPETEGPLFLNSDPVPLAANTITLRAGLLLEGHRALQSDTVYPEQLLMREEEVQPDIANEASDTAGMQHGGEGRDNVMQTGYDHQNYSRGMLRAIVLYLMFQ